MYAVIVGMGCTFTMYNKFVKRVLDIAVSLVGIVVLSIPMLIVAIVVKLDSKGPVLFKQKRIGINKTYFYIYKFRSMPVDVPSDIPTHQFVNSDKCLSGWQRFIRKFSIDELPQLFNILSGQMSVIGPRPALWNQYDLIEERDKYGANSVRPGLTGWAQINGRDELEIPEKAKLDGEYVSKLSFLFDCRCFFGTVLAVINHKGFEEGCAASGESDLDSRDVVFKD